MLAGDEVAAVNLGNWRSGDLPVRGRRKRRICGHVLDQLFSARQFTVGEALFGAWIGHLPIRRCQRGRIGVPSRGSGLHQQLARG